MHTDDSQTRLADMEFVRQLMAEPLLDAETEKELVLAWRDEKDEDALHQLIRSFSRLVISISIRFRFYGIPLSDLIQEGNIGLLCATERFDLARGVRFSTYAKWWIRANMQDYVLRNWSIVRTGSTTNQKALFFNLKRLKTEILGVSTDQLTEKNREEISETLHVTIKDVEEMEKRLLQQDLSLSSPFSNLIDQSWQDFIEDDQLGPEELTSQAQDKKLRKYWIDFAMDQLSDNERHVIVERRLQENEKTLETIGNEMNISKERVRQIEQKALRKMRHALLHHIHEVRELL